MIKGLYIMDKSIFEDVYSKSNQNEIEEYVDIYSDLLSAEELSSDLSILKDAEVLFFSWGSPRMDDKFLKAAKSLKAVFYGAGSVKNIVTPEFWKQDIKLTSAYAANAVPVAEFTLAQILFSLKSGWQHMDNIRISKNYTSRLRVTGGYKSVIGLVSLGMIGRKVIELLKPFDLEIIAYDPFITEQDATDLGVKQVSLEELFKKSNIVSLHTPWLKETEGMINGHLFSLMKNGATFINTSRGAVVNEKEMIDILTIREDITALLDVTYPEPPVAGSQLYNMKNIFLTPHIAGSLDSECGRMGYYMVEELRRYIEDKDFRWNITEERAKTLA